MVPPPAHWRSQISTNGLSHVMCVCVSSRALAPQMLVFHMIISFSQHAVSRSPTNSRVTAIPLRRERLTRTGARKISRRAARHSNRV